MARKASLSGFPEWLPEERAIEVHCIDILRKVFLLHGFSEIETRAVEPISQMLQKGEIDKEIYVISRFHDEGSSKKDPLALHFDLTVPFARYVKDNVPFLNFPFKRFQIQKVWRGERPQDGRQREFTQVDIDIVNEETLPLESEAELLTTILEALKALPLPGFTVRINNRKISEGFYRAHGIENPSKVLQLIDKLEKIGPEKVSQLLHQEGLTAKQIEAALSLAQIRDHDTDRALSQAKSLMADASDSDLFDQGYQELQQLLSMIDTEHIDIDFSIARGLDYYTGTVYETELTGHEDLGSICSGGRYDSLVHLGKKSYPGVGISIGLSRLLSRLIGNELITMNRKHPAVVYIALNNDQERRQVAEVAQKLRSRGIPVEQSLKAAKFGKQIKNADKLAIPYVWFIQEDGSHQIKDIRTGKQFEVDAATWTPATEELTPSLITHFN
ncbi:MAG: histidine--tRNA ligase [Micrococcaceae bacterium]